MICWIFNTFITPSNTFEIMRQFNEVRIAQNKWNWEKEKYFIDTSKSQRRDEQNWSTMQNLWTLAWKKKKMQMLQLHNNSIQQFKTSWIRWMQDMIVDLLWIVISQQVLLCLMSRWKFSSSIEKTYWQVWIHL